VFPGQPGASHQHEFFGNRTTNAHSTLASLDAGATTCVRPKNKSGYWVPALYKDGVRVQPFSATVYYRGAGLQPNVLSIPRGLKIVAGNAKATKPQSAAVISWHCRSSGIGRGFTYPPSQADCSPGAPFRYGITAGVRFPNCLHYTMQNGTKVFDLDSPNHQSHMTTASGTPKACPPSYHPMPQVQVEAHYSTFGPGVTLSSGPHYTLHADAFFAWDKVELKRLIDTCINPIPPPDCGSGG
jgi:hypothetical protein